MRNPNFLHGSGRRLLPELTVPARVGGCSLPALLAFTALTCALFYSLAEVLHASFATRGQLAVVVDAAGSPLAPSSLPYALALAPALAALASTASSAAAVPPPPAASASPLPAGSVPPSSAPVSLPPAGACTTLVTHPTTRWPARVGVASEPAAAPAGGGSSPPLWRLELCTAAASSASPPPPYACPSCAGTLRVTRLRGCPATAQCNSSASASPAACLAACRPPLKSDTSLPLLLQAAAEGPDELDLFLEGPEFHRLTPVHTGSCVYLAPFAAALPGTYRLGAYAVRSDWEAIDETRPVFPPYTVDDAAGPRVLLQLGTSSQAAALAAWQSATRAGSAASAAAAAATPTLPACANFSQAASPGRWVSSRSPVELLQQPPRPAYLPSYLVNDAEPGVGIDSVDSGSGSGSGGGGGSGDGVYYTDLVQGLQWQPYACVRAPPHLAPTPASTACLTRASLTVAGDSQLRTLFNHLMSRLVGIEGAAVKGVEGSSCVSTLPGVGGAGAGADTAAWVPGLFSCFTFAPMGEGVVDPSYGGTAEPHPTALLVNWGQHYASAHRVGLQDYAAFLRGKLGSSAFVEAVQERAREAGEERRVWAAGPAAAAAQPPKKFTGLVWVETQPLPRRNDAFIHSKGDWRTSPRLRLYNRAAEAVLGEVRQGLGEALLHTLPTFDVVAAVMDASHDHAHLDLGSEALDVLTERLLAILCE